jgi:2-keto-4-pentenoate hydratase/2-oxohepta-3-ene-1,7-dioic acid hydratase in catechol pathway
VKLAVFDDFRLGVIEGDRVRDVTAVVPAAFDTLPRQRMNWLIGHWAEAQGALRRAIAEAPAQALSAVTLLPPNPGAGQVYAAPANYRKHIGELGDRAVTKASRSAREQGFFLKAPASMVGAGGALLLPRGSTRRFDHESELAVFIGREARNVPRAAAMACVFGYACLIDATMRIEPGVAEEERSMRKSFDTFTPVGPWLVTADEVPDPQNLANRLWVNGVLKQEASTRDMIVGIAELIELVSSVVTLRPGDVIASGTPEGVGPLVPGDTVRIAIESVGEMTLPVREQAERSPRAY